jgi:squalene synthase HpnC
MDDVLDYCHYSANPVGHLVLYVCGYRDEERFRLSDHTCTALQLANFWQDVREDHLRNRIYFPQSDMHRFGVDEATIATSTFTQHFRELMRYEVEYAHDTMRQGLPLIGMVNRDLALDLDLFSRGGLEILRAIEEQDYNVLKARPVISKPRKAALLVRALTGKFLGRSLAQQRPAA